MIKMTTNFGVIEIELFTEQAPNTTANFTQYVNDGFFDGLIFHRVIPNFMIQGGGFEPGMKQKSPKAPIQNEADNGLKNERGTLSMARTNDPHSATSQFFISVKDNAFLDFKSKDASGWGYTVFAKVVSGMDVVDSIAQTPTGNSGGHGDVPLEDVVIEKAEVVQ
ncbi:peptidylprolyl isomerase [Gammaproteobacteria bacterium]|nr:peptidylprolyl isomerase [Gammaproteobacteria bacterium]